MPANHETIHTAYRSFNARHADAVLALMTPDVAWPNGWEGGYVQGQAEVRSYWTRQWAEIDPTVTPTDMHTLEDGRVDVTVRQVVKDLSGNPMMDITLHHIYTFTPDGLISRMEIVE